MLDADNNPFSANNMVNWYFKANGCEIKNRAIVLAFQQLTNKMIDFEKAIRGDKW
jgi:hypothetical protein